jgi:hypothetical protein
VATIDTDWSARRPDRGRSAARASRPWAGERIRSRHIAIVDFA